MLMRQTRPPFPISLPPIPDSLGPIPCAELLEGTALQFVNHPNAHVHSVRDLFIEESLGHILQQFVFASRERPRTELVMRWPFLMW